MQIDRKHHLLHTLIREHVATGSPVGSKLLSQKSDDQLSPATIRNEMAQLEGEGFITHLHTSAGRIPTAKGWKFYIEHIMKEKNPSEVQRKELASAIHEGKQSFDEAMKSIARTLAQMSKNASIVGFSADDVYYTGLSHLFSEPEFENLNLVRRISEVVDHLDDVMHRLFADMDQGVAILVGRENPFGEECGVILNKFERNGRPQMYGILGPARMQYDRNLGFVTYTSTLL